MQKQKQKQSKKSKSNGDGDGNGDGNAKRNAKAKSKPNPKPWESDTEEPNYLLMVHMTLSDDPMISRLLSLPPHLTLDKFHDVLQIAFGWAGCHMHSFTVTLLDPDAKRPYPRPVACLKPMMEDEDDMEPDMGFIELDEADYTLQDVFSRDIFSREAFENTEWKASKVKPKMELGLEYEYDHGDSWTHNITLLGRADPGLHRMAGGPNAPAVLCFGGEGHPCAEDCGSAPGWKHLKEVFTKPRMKDPDDLKDWYKNECANGDPKGLDPWKWDNFQVNRDLSTLEL